MVSPLAAFIILWKYFLHQDCLNANVILDSILLLRRGYFYLTHTKKKYFRNIHTLARAAELILMWEAQEATALRKKLKENEKNIGTSQSYQEEGGEVEEEVK